MQDQLKSNHAIQVDNQGAVLHDKEAGTGWTQTAAKLSRDLLLHSGVDAGPCDLLLHLRPCEGLVRSIDGTIEKRFSKAEHPLPIQVRLFPHFLLVC